MRTSGSSRFSCAVALAIIFAVASPAIAAEASPAESKGWEFDIVPYVWGAGIEGQVKLGRLPSESVDASFSDIWDYLSIAGMAAFEVRKDNWGLLVDAIYIDLGDTVPTPDPLYTNIDASMTQQLYSGLITYRFYDGNKTTIDVGWGARYYRIDADFELTAGAVPGRSASGTVSWWDWLAGVRVVGHPSKRWSLTGYADIGGGGSVPTWEAMFGADFAFNKTVSLAFGYRYLSIDYEADKFVYDVAMQGPFVGVGFHF